MSENNDNEGLPGLPAAIDTGPQDMEKLAGIPLRAQQIGALLASGFNHSDIDRAFDLPEGTASAYRIKYFDRRDMVISQQTRDKIISAYLRGKAIGLVAGITPAKIDKAGVGELAKSAGMLLQRAESLEGSNQVQDIGSRISSALSKLAQLSVNQSDAKRLEKANS